MNTDTRRSWLSSLAPGDSLALRRRYGFGHDVLVVERITKTLIVTTTGERLNREVGRTVGVEDYATRFADPVTPEIAERVEVERNLHTLRQLSDEKIKVSPETLRRMIAAFEEGQS